MLLAFLAIQPYAHYQLNGTLRYPLAGISYPISAYMNATTYIFSQAAEATQIWNDQMYHYLRTEGTEPACYSKNVEWVQRQVYLPDLSDFVLQDRKSVV